MAKTVRKTGTVKKVETEANRQSFDLLRMEFLTCMGDEKLFKRRIEELSVGEIQEIATYVGSNQERLEEVNKEIAEITKSLTEEASLLSTKINPMKEVLLKALEAKHQKTMITPEGWFANVKPGTARSEFTCTIPEFIELLQEAGHSDAIDDVLKIGKTAAEAVLGKTVVNRVIKTTKPEYGSVVITKA